MAEASHLLGANPGPTGWAAKDTPLPEDVRDFEPPFCPNPACEHHLREGHERWPWVAKGYERLRRAPGWVRLFRCKSCGRSFRDACFKADYWKKVAGLHGQIFHSLCEGQCLRQVARDLEISHEIVLDRAAQLGKQALLLQLETLRQVNLGGPAFRVVFDGLRDKVGSKSEPCDVNTAVIEGTQLFVDVEMAGLRRSGTMTEEQREQREERDEELGVPEEDVRKRKCLEAFERMLEQVDERGLFFLITDEEPDYRRAIDALDEAKQARVIHVTVSSKRRRDTSNPLWRINHVHKLMRHALATVKRKTIAFAKTSAGMIRRAVLFGAWLNWVKGLSERCRKESKVTPAMLHGLAATRISRHELFRWRRFPKRVGLPEELVAIYEGTIKNRPNERHEPYVHSYAY
jgi:hypothetical protein